MAKEIIMPALGMAQETGVLLEWLKAEGDEVAKGEPLMEIETDKAAVEVEAPASGILAYITAQPGDEVPVGQVIAVILGSGETVPDSLVATEATGTAPSQPKVEPILAPAVTPPVTPLAARMAAEHQLDLQQIAFAGGRIQKEDVLAHLEQQTKNSMGPDGRVLASPKARRLAREQGLALAVLNGSGPEGAVLAADVELAVKAAAVSPLSTPPLKPVASATSLPAAGLTTPVSRMWQVMADRLNHSWTTVPHFYLTTEVNAGRLIAWREEVRQRATEKITFTDLLTKLVAVSLRKHPTLNGMWQEKGIALNEKINIGLAVAVDEGLLVPVIHQADRLGLSEIAARRRELVDRAKSGKLSPAEMSDGTFTISNLGMFGIDAFSAIVNPPQAAILAVGRIAERVVPLNGQPAVQPMLTLTLSCDHRVVDGARGGQFLHTLVTLIENPLAVLD